MFYFKKSADFLITAETHSGFYVLREGTSGTLFLKLARGAKGQGRQLAII
jgi:hypothetical protein